MASFLTNFKITKNVVRKIVLIPFLILILLIEALLADDRPEWNHGLDWIDF